jgi:hypothetical protein
MYTRNLHLLLCAALLAGLSSCAEDGPTDPDDPPEETVPAPNGAYTLRLEVAASCPAPARAFTFNVRVAAGDTPRYAGIQGYLEGVPLQDGDAPMLEMEFQYTGTTLRGTLGTTYGGAASREGPFVTLWATGFATVVAADGRGEVREGTLLGDIAFGADVDDEGGLGTCDATQHRWSLRPR